MYRIFLFIIILIRLICKKLYFCFYYNTGRILYYNYRKNTQVVLVASNRDAHHEPIFPTPQYAIFNKKLQNYPNLKLMPDPCILDVAGLKIGVTSVDVIKHIGKEEIS